MKRLFIVIAAVLIGFTASAQKIGVTAGITGPDSSLKGSEIGAFDQYHAGLVANFPVMEGLRLQPELIYKVKGCSLEDLINEGGKIGDKIDTSVGFLEFGIEAQAGIGAQFLRVYGLLEPFIGYNINDKFNIRDKNSVAELSWGKTEYGLAIGAGAELLEMLQLSVKYFWNMGTVEVKDESKKIINGDEVRNFNGVTLSLSLLF